MACSTHIVLRTGSVPGSAASKKETCELGMPCSNAARDPEKSFVLVWSCA